MLITVAVTWSVYIIQLVGGKNLDTLPKESGKYKFCPSLAGIQNGSIEHHNDNSAQYVVFKCSEGYKLDSNIDKYKCDQVTGKWKNLDLFNLPRCMKNQEKCEVPRFQHGILSTSSFKTGAMYCYNGFSLMTGSGKMKSSPVQCLYNTWYYTGTTELVKDCLEDISARCQDPPSVQNAILEDKTFQVYAMYSKRTYKEGQKAYYHCNTGFQFTSTNYLTCRNGQWIGDTPFCIKSCSKPPEISNAQWMIPSRSFYHQYNIYPVGTRVRYQCLNDFSRSFTMVGKSVIECGAQGRWSSLPICLNSQDMPYCQLPILTNGECQCFEGAEECSALIRGSKVECICNIGYHTSGHEILTCQDGTWDHFPPQCLLNSDPISSEDSSSETDKGHMNTLAIVVATACSVLGLLLLVMVVVVFRRRKPHHHHSRLYHQGANTPPYQRVHSNHLEEHDRVALIGYESARLPTYEEATRVSASRSPENGTRQPAAGNEYRPLPNIPSNLLNSVQSHNNNNNNNNNNLDNTSRHSVITTSTFNRDGVSETFGSIDTINFSTSDASTSLTVDTLDSRTSRPSNASGIATAGSLESVNAEDAPLLENTENESNVESTTGDPEICSEPEDKEVV